MLLFCFHHAGGTASVFARWRGALAPGIDVRPVTLPGREGRRGEPMPRDMESLAADLDAGLGPLLDEPHAFYGHSMGALVAYTIARRRTARGARVPDRLLAGACAAPHLSIPLAAAHRLPDEELTRAVQDIGGLSPVLLDYPDWLAVALTRIRADLRLCAGHRPASRLPLPCPVEVFAATDDPLVSMADAAAWADHTGAGCTVHPVSGGHFFLLDPAVDLPSRLAAVLAPGRLPSAANAVQER
ncbi:thioesterase II family protein [Actinomadura sp. GTD37]|uniref:thioesterase II family protein n=1 Tax=Actinomadura sp. GTD37 TaxID=1778030 RepID=UPI0035BFE23A